MSRFKLLLLAAVLLTIVAVILATGNVYAGDPTGGGHNIITALV
jgi:hypothetical protein